MTTRSANAAAMHLELAAALRQPRRALTWPLATWEHQVRLARRLRLLARLAAALESENLLDDVAAEPRRHLHSDLQLSRWRTGAMRWAIERIGASLMGRGYPIVLLKGAAYLGQDLAIARGRLPSDLDILVPQAAIEDAQQQLRLDGWQEMELNLHDQRYYLEWSHEVPPMRHPAMRMELDLHHNILPPVSRPRVDAALLFGRIEPSRWNGWHVLSAADQFLHASAHLFCDSVFRDRLRDLVDLDGLARAFGTGSQFWSDVAVRAPALGLHHEFMLACHYLVSWLGTPIPEAVRPKPSVVTRALLLPLLSKALMPLPPDDEPGWRDGLADTALLCRYHLKRLPLRLLIPHLAHKVICRAPAEQAR